MKFLRKLTSIFRRPERTHDAYEAEVQFAGWVNLPPLFAELKDQRPPASESKRTIGA